MFTKNRYKIDSLFMDCRRAQSGEQAVVLVHGIGVSSNYYMPLAEILARQYDVHVVDMPGYLDTPKPPKPLSPLEQSEILAGYLEQLGIHNAIIVGHSMGSQTATHLAANYPGYCKKLILIGPTVNKWERHVLLQAFRLFCDTLVEPLKVNALILHDYLHMGMPAYLTTTGYMITDHIEDSLKNVSSPLCIIRGNRDWIAPQKWVEYLTKIARNGQSHAIPRGPHNVQYPYAKEVAAVCSAFIAD